MTKSTKEQLSLKNNKESYELDQLSVHDDNQSCIYIENRTALLQVSRKTLLFRYSVVMDLVTVATITNSAVVTIFQREIYLFKLIDDVSSEPSQETVGQVGGGDKIGQNVTEVVSQPQGGC